MKILKIQNKKWQKKSKLLNINFIIIHNNHVNLTDKVSCRRNAAGGGGKMHNLPIRVIRYDNL